ERPRAVAGSHLGTRERGPGALLGGGEGRRRRPGDRGRGIRRGQPRRARRPGARRPPRQPGPGSGAGGLLGARGRPAGRLGGAGVGHRATRCDRRVPASVRGRL
ncbi:MAG: hypothetical protein AVDCRST_MAG24-740, partial [uncultured Nocardioidaceae bacterium]